MCPLHLSLRETALVNGDQALCSMIQRVVLLYVACAVPFVRCALESRILGLCHVPSLQEGQPLRYQLVSGSQKNECS